MAENDEPLIQTPADFGHFLLEKELGHGGMGGVYLARDKMLDRKVGIKVMLKSLGDDPTFVERFQREAQAAARLNHPNIAQIYSFGQEQGMPYIAMELVSGGSLDKEMEENLGTMDPVRVMRIGQQMVDALALAAEQGLVHGDVKPENVLFDSDGNAKLVDFGLAAMQSDSNEIWGTPYYISPEKVRRQKVDYRADIYSLGGTLYHVLTGVPPFDGPDPTAVVKARFEAPPKKPSEIRPDLPPEIDTIIMRMLELEPSMRYPTYQSLMGDFKRFLSKAKPAKNTTKLAGPKVKIKGAKPKIKLTAEENGGGDDEVAELEPIEGDETAEKKGMSVGAMVGLVVGGVILLILLVVGGLLWYVHAGKVAEQKAEIQRIISDQEEARTKLAGTVKTATSFAAQFDELVRKTDKDVATAVREIKGLIPDDMKELVMPLINVPPTKDIAEAIAYTNELFMAAAAGAAAEANQKAAEEKAAAEASTNAPAASANAATAAANAATNAPAAATNAATNAPAAATNAATNAPAAKGQQVDSGKGAKPSEEKIEEGEEEKAEEEKKPDVEIPAALKQFADLWEDVYFCRASNIRIQGRVKLLLEKAKKIDELTAVDKPTRDAIIKLNNAIAEECNEITSMKCRELTQRKVGIISRKSLQLTREAKSQFARIKARAEKAAKEAAEKKAKEELEAKLAEEYKAKVEEETKAIQEKYDDLGADIKHLDWERCIKQLQQAMSEFTTSEGKEEGRSLIKKIQAMQGLQKHFAAKAKGFKFKNGAVVTSVDEKGIVIQTVKKVKGKAVPDKEIKAEWERFLGRKEYVGLLNQMLNGLVLKGRETTGIGPKPWSEHMLGAALLLQALYSDVEGVDAFVPILVKKAAKEFDHCAKDAKKWFPDVELEATDE